jgi:hypothetical protein
VYYELDEQRKKSERTDVAICRVEQLCPFPYDLIQRELKRYPSTLIHKILAQIFQLSCYLESFSLPQEIECLHAFALGETLFDTVGDYLGCYWGMHFKMRRHDREKNRS